MENELKPVSFANFINHISHKPEKKSKITKNKNNAIVSCECPFLRKFLLEISTMTGFFFDIYH